MERSIFIVKCAFESHTHSFSYVYYYANARKEQWIVLSNWCG